MSVLRKSEEYSSFRSTVSRKKITVDSVREEVWSVYDAGPRSVRCPLIFLPPVSSYSDIFYLQLISLASHGFRVIAVDYPAVWSHDAWCESFRKLLDALQLDRVHIFGSSLGGFLAMKFAEYTCVNQRVQSILVCNGFADTAVFERSRSSSAFWAMPAFLLKKWVLSHLPTGPAESSIADSVDFVVDQLEGMPRNELAARLTLNCLPGYVEPQKLSSVAITIMDVFDDSALSVGVKEEMYKCFPEAKRAHLKKGGNFPYLSYSAEVNVYIQVHLKAFENDRFSAKEDDIDASVAAAGGGGGASYAAAAAAED
eukprot:scpid44007/ scgid33709/ Maspardin; Acid cluster protein 33; Spastic paraplegia 21 autosomal recessive Mast syndrome protein homolog